MGEQGFFYLGETVGEQGFLYLVGVSGGAGFPQYLGYTLYTVMEQGFLF